MSNTCYKCGGEVMIDSCICAECHRTNPQWWLQSYCPNCEEPYNTKDAYENQECDCGYTHD
jgi:hypothetical protein